METLLMAPGGYVAASVILFFIGFIGFFANLTVIVLMCRDPQLWTPLNYILFNLIMSDFSVSLLGNPFTLASAVSTRWIFGRNMCVAYGFGMALLGIASITTLTVLSLERYLIISRPLNRTALSRRSAVVIIGAVWLYAFTVTAPPLVGWGEYGPEAANISCSISWEKRDSGSTSYIVFLFTFGFFLPLFIICYSYINIVVTVRQNATNKKRVTKAESRVAWMISGMICAFFIAWTPYAVFAILIAFADCQVSPAVATIPAIFAKTSICYNPIIYVGLNTQFRKSWKRMFRMGLSPESSYEAAVVNDLSPKKSRISSVVTNSIDTNHILKSSRVNFCAVGQLPATETAI